MNHPFTDTPANRRFAEMIDLCTTPKGLRFAENDRHQFHVMPQYFLSFNREARAYEPVIESSYIVAIDKKTGTLGLKTYTNHIDLHEFLEDVEVMSSDQMITKYKDIGLFNDTGEPSGGFSLLSVNTFEHISDRTQDLNRVVTVKPRSEQMEDFAECVADSDMYKPKPRITLNLPDISEEDYHDAAMAYREELGKRMRNTGCEFAERVKDAYYTNLTQVIIQHTDWGQEKARDIVDRMGRYCPNLEGAFRNLNGQSIESLRNRLQALSLVNGSADAFRQMLWHQGIHDAITQGNSLRDAFRGLPLANTSKKTCQRFFSNLAALEDVSAGGRQPFQMSLEKGVVDFDYNDINKHRIPTDKRLAFVALMTTLPEAYFKKGSERETIVNNMFQVMTLPSAISTFTRMVEDVKSGSKEFKTSLAWVPEFLARTDDIGLYGHQITDTANMITDMYLYSIERHVRVSSPGFEDDRNCVFEMAIQNPQVKDEELLASYEKTGDYRKIIHAEADTHRLIRQFYRDGKPAHDLEWEPAIEAPFECDGLLISSIDSNVGLTIEGNVLKHCVASYLTDVLEHESYIFSVTKDDEKRSTIELKRDDDDKLYIAQHRGFDNQAPSDKEVQAAERFVEALNNDELDFNPYPCEGIDGKMEDLTPLQKEEVQMGVAFSDRDFILKVIDNLQVIAPQWDVFATLRSDASMDAGAIDDLEDAYREHARENAQQLSA